MPIYLNLTCYIANLLAAAVSQLTLVDVILHVPQLLDTVPNSCWGALLATCSAVKQHLHQHVIKISSVQKSGPVTTFEGNALVQLGRGTWPMLRSLVLRGAKLSREDFKTLSSFHWPLLLMLDLSNTDFKGSDWAHLSRGRWPNLLVLLLKDNDFTVGCDAVSPQPDWPLLKALNFSRSRVDYHAMQQLIACKWPCLEGIHFEGSCLDDLALSVLSKAKWPKLTNLTLSKNSIDAQGMADLVKGSFAGLQCLDLDKLLLTPAAIAHLQLGHWPNLEAINLSCTTGAYLTADESCIQPFDKAQWPRLRHLVLSNDYQECYPAQLVTELVKAEWPLLQTLFLVGSLIPAGSLATLSRGAWPLLEKLQVMVIRDLNEDSVRALVLGDWPNLQDLTLTSVITPAAQQEEDSNAESHLQVKKKRFLKLIGDRWPSLVACVILKCL